MRLKVRRVARARLDDRQVSDRAWPLVRSARLREVEVAARRAVAGVHPLLDVRIVGEQDLHLGHDAHHAHRRLRAQREVELAVRIPADGLRRRVVTILRPDEPHRRLAALAARLRAPEQQVAELEAALRRTNREGACSKMRTVNLLARVDQELGSSGVRLSLGAQRRMSMICSGAMTCSSQVCSFFSAMVSFA